ncbi:MAG: hypothetical protein ACJAXF_001269, partial [Polaribacter sp.]
MIEHSFSKQMGKKSNQDLEKIFEEKEQYTDEAIEAVILELEKRNLIDKAVILAHKKNLEENRKELTISKNYKVDESPFEELVQPILYSKKAIQGFA